MIHVLFYSLFRGVFNLFCQPMMQIHANFIQNNLLRKNNKNEHFCRKVVIIFVIMRGIKNYFYLLLQ